MFEASTAGVAVNRRQAGTRLMERCDLQDIPSRPKGWRM